MPEPIWNLTLTFMAIFVAGVLILDADWMVKLARNGLEVAPPPLFKAPIRIEGRWRRAGYLAFAILSIVPMFMLPFMGILSVLASPMLSITLLALGASVVVSILAGIFGFPRIGSVAAAAIAVLLVAPYALAGPVGWTRYLFIIGTTITILSFLFIVAQAHKTVLGYRPRSRLGTWVRLLLDSCLVLAAVAAMLWLNLN